MTQQTINYGAVANDGTGDPLRTLASKSQANFTELYALQSQTINAGSPTFTGTKEQKIQAAITAAVAASATRVFVPTSLIPYQASLVTFNSTVQMVAEGADQSTYDVRAYGALADGTTDDTSAFQAAITASAGAPVLAHAGSYKITSTLTYNTAGAKSGLTLKGDGQRVTTFLNGVANGPLLSMSGDNGGGFQYGMQLSDFAISPSGLPANSRGIDIRGSWIGNIERVRITSMSSDAIRVTCTIGDDDSSANLGIKRCALQSNGGWGINCVDASGVITTAFLDIEHNVIGLNTLGGIRVFALVTKIHKNSIFQNGTTGISAPYDGTSCRFLTIVENEIDSNTVSHINIAGLLVGQIENNWFKASDPGTGVGFVPPNGVLIGDGTNTVQGVSVVRNMTSLNPAASAHTAFTVAAAGVTDTRLIDNTFSSFSAPAVRYLDGGSSGGNSTIIRDDAGTNKTRLGYLTTTVGAAGTATPDLRVATVFRIVCTGATATVAAPIGGGDSGDEIVIKIYNASGGVLAVTFNAVFQKGGYTNPANGKETTARFLFDPNSTNYEQIGAWSPDI